MRGKFKGKRGRVTEVKIKTEKILVEKIQIKKKDGSSVNFPLNASNLQIVELDAEDKKRMKRFVKEEKKTEKKENKEKEKEK